LSPYTAQWNWRATILIGALCTTIGATVPDAAHAQGLFDLFFDMFQQRPAPPPQQNAYPSPPPGGVGRVAPAPLEQESVTEGGGGTGHSVAFCVRLCDGQHFPLEQLVMGRREKPAARFVRTARPRSFLAAKLVQPSLRTASIMLPSRWPFCTASNWWPIAPATAETRSDLPHLM
jgi:hypothetical protein